jgi:hypothetical protein
MLFLWPKTELQRAIGVSPGGWWNSEPQKAHVGNKGFSIIPKMYGEKCIYVWGMYLGTLWLVTKNTKFF